MKVRRYWRLTLRYLINLYMYLQVFITLSCFLAGISADTVSFSSFQIGSGPVVHTSLGGHHEPTLHHQPHVEHAHPEPAHHAAPHHAPAHHAPVHHAPAHHAPVHHAPVHHAPVHHAHHAVPHHAAPHHVAHHAQAHHVTPHHAHHAAPHHIVHPAPAHHAHQVASHHVAHAAPVHHAHHAAPIHSVHPIHPAPHHVAHPAPVHRPAAHHFVQQPVEVRAEEPLGDIVDVAVGAGSFKTLVKIVSDLGLVDTLKNAEALTVFAPSDDAFAKLPQGTLESLTPDQAKAIVLRHVVSAKVPAASVVSGPVRTLGGEDIYLVKSANGVQVNFNGGTSNVITADVFASNGVIHVIDKVIL